MRAYSYMTREDDDPYALPDIEVFEIMLRLRHFNGEDGGECAAAAALILPRHYHEEKSFD